MIWHHRTYEVTNNVVKRSKPEMCSDIKAALLIDDSAKYACQCATSCGDAFLTVLSVRKGGTRSQVPQIGDGSLQTHMDSGKVVRVASWETQSEVLARHLDRLDGL